MHKYLPPEKETRESIYVPPGEPCSLDILPEKIELVTVYENEQIFACVAKIRTEGLISRTKVTGERCPEV